MELLLGALEESTWSSYDTAIKSYLDFAKRQGAEDPWNPSPGTLLAWPTSLFRRTPPLSFKSIKKYLAGVKDVFDNSPVKHPQAPLFQDDQGHALTYAAIVKAVKVLAEACGFNPKNFSGHSFRIGGATTMGILKFPPEVIRQLGRWESTCYQRYVRVAPMQLRQVGVAFGEARETSRDKMFGGLSDVQASKLQWEDLVFSKLSFR